MYDVPLYTFQNGSHKKLEDIVSVEEDVERKEMLVFHFGFVACWLTE